MKNPKFLLLQFVFLLMSTNLFSQNTEAIETWHNSTLADYLGRKYEDTHFLNNLLSDKYFIPAFGKSFGQLSSSERLRINSKIEKLYRKQEFITMDWKYPWARSLSFILGRVFSHEKDYKWAVGNIEIINRIREECTESMESIKLDEVTFKGLVNITLALKSQYAKVLTPSEIQIVLKMIKERETSLADEALHLIIENSSFEEIEVLESLKNQIQSISPQSVLARSTEEIKTLSTDFHGNYLLFSSASAQAKAEASKLVSNRIDSLVTRQAKDLTQSISSKNVEKNDLEEIYEKWYRIESIFKKYQSLPAVVDLFETFRVSANQYLAYYANTNNNLPNAFSSWAEIGKARSAAIQLEKQAKAKLEREEHLQELRRMSPSGKDIIPFQNLGYSYDSHEALIVELFYGRFNEAKNFVRKYGKLKFTEIHNNFLYHSREGDITREYFTGSYVDVYNPITGETKSELRQGKKKYTVTMESRFVRYFNDTYFVLFNTEQPTIYENCAYIRKFLELYPKGSIEHKQLKENIYRYSQGLPPVSDLSELNIDGTAKYANTTNKSSVNTQNTNITPPVNAQARSNTNTKNKPVTLVISGKITDKQDKKPIQSVSVLSLPVIAKTGAGGEYEIKVRFSGEINAREIVSVNHDNYKPYYSYGPIEATYHPGGVISIILMDKNKDSDQWITKRFNEEDIDQTGVIKCRLDMEMEKK